MDMFTLLYLKWRTNTILLYSTGNFAQCYVAAGMGGEMRENGYRPSKPYLIYDPFRPTEIEGIWYHWPAMGRARVFPSALPVMTALPSQV